ncbi:MAG TPA: sugar transferase [Candidatus Angelobacter sp.]|nr:sugar transferase [Candidatus Angelobacter sp.]
MSASLSQASAHASERVELMQELCRLYSPNSTGTVPALRRFRLLYKRYAWWTVVGGANALKRAIDIFVALSMLAALFPMFAFVALMIKLTDRGPILFWQVRVGKWGQEFPFPKFRSMVMNAEQLKDKLLEQNQHADSKTFKMKNDPRITWIGRIIRKLSIDELPQLWCVLNGNMSLVGPRPPLPREVAQYTLLDRRRLDAVPGLTCIWQVSGRGDIPFPQQVELDVEYIHSRSVFKDLKILVMTIPAVLLGKGAY